MKRMKQVGIFVAGFTTAIIIFFGANSVGASSLFTSIYVNFSQIKIFIDGQERNPPADMKPFVYDGRTYVSLRYVGEAFGKKVDWDGATRSVIITEPRAQLTQYYESFADDTTAGKYWIKTDGNIWKFDGPNGLSVKRIGRLVLHDVLPDSYCNYTVEFDAASPVGKDGLYTTLTYFCLGKDNNGNLGDVFYIGSEWQHGSVIRYSKVLNTSSTGSELSTLTEWKSILHTNDYVRVKIQVKDRYASIYLNDRLFVTKEVSMGASAFAFLGYGTSELHNRFDYYIKNFSITINQ